MPDTERMPEFLREYYEQELHSLTKPTLFVKRAALSKIREQPFFGEDKQDQVVKWKTYD